MGNQKLLDKAHCKEQMRLHKICVIVPTYNNAGTIAQVVERCLAYTDQLIVVADGCTDRTDEVLSIFADHITLVQYTPNRGKGHALKTGFRKAKSLGYQYAITIDSDGQHYPEDIPVFLEAFEQHPHSLLIGSRCLTMENMPSKNTFANKFSNFWFYVQTGIKLPDTQTGYRLYPLQRLKMDWFLSSRYEAELAMLVYFAWNATPLIPVPIRVYYPPQGERVTHFRPCADFVRISLLNTILCFCAVFVRIYQWLSLPFRLIKR